MGDKTIIAWTSKTFNLVWGCVEVGPGCDACYARVLSKRMGFAVWGKDADRRTFGESYWREPLKWNAQAQKSGERQRVFCSSMCDVFEKHATVDAEREKLWPLIRQTPWLDWQLLTKRAERIQRCLPKDWGKEGWPNVWIGVSVENQQYAKVRLPFLIKIPAVVRFVSAEPLLEEVDFRPWLHGLDWILIGGESGPGYRNMDHAWARSLVKQCREFGVAPFFKQSAAPRTEMGIHLDGKIIREYPTPRKTEGGPNPKPGKPGKLF